MLTSRKIGLKKVRRSSALKAENFLSSLGIRKEEWHEE
jgi:hypothetical protein